MLGPGDLIPLVAIIMGTSLLGLRMYLSFRYGPRRRFSLGTDSEKDIDALREEIQAHREEVEADRQEMNERIDFLERALIDVRNRPQLGKTEKTPV